jgi:hypothetical protein
MNTKSNRTKTKRQNKVQQHFTAVIAYGSWMVRMTNADGEARMIALCTRKSDADCITTALNAQHVESSKAKAKAKQGKALD